SVVCQWLEQKRAANAEASAPPSTAAGDGTASDSMPMNYFMTRIALIREHITGLIAALPDLSADFNRAFIILHHEFEERGLIELLVVVAVFAALGFGTEVLFVWATTRARARIAELPLHTVRERLWAMMARSALIVGRLAVSAVGSIGAFLLFDWPPLLRQIVLGYLLAFLAWRIALVGGRLLLAPPSPLFRDAERFRIIPMNGDAALFWDRRVALAVGWFVFGYVTVELLATLGFASPARELVAYAFGLGLLAIGIDMAWRQPRTAAGADVRSRK